MTDTIGALESRNLSMSGLIEVSGGVEESDFTSGGFSTLEVIPKKRADDRDAGLHEFPSGDGMVRVLAVKSIVEQEGVNRGKDRYYLSQSAGRLLNDFFRIESANTS